STDVPFSVSTVRAGLNAQFSVNGIAVERPTNLADDVVEGVSFNLKQTGSATVTVTRDPGKVKEKIKAFVDAYNDVFTELRAQQNFAERDGKAVLYGETALERIASTLKDAARGAVSGLDPAFDALSDLGIRVDGKGKLTVKDEDLEAALSADYEAATKLFTRIGTGEARGVARAVAAEVGSVITGVIAQRTGSIGSRQSSLTKQITEIEARLEKYADSLRRKYANLETYVGRFQSYGSSLGAL
ncbi:MAG TPA: flagellar filament capping protein FliD, partial [Planctomycetota bacterium]|nr:flagellar filament capping protein FliD [Planctomycetota bacterium]